MIEFIRSLLSGNEKGVNSIVTCGVGGMLVHFLVTIGVGGAMLFHDPAAFFSGFGSFVTAFVGGIAGIITAMGAAKTVHDGVMSKVEAVAQ